MKISTDQKFLKKVYQIRFVELWNFMLSWDEHEKKFFKHGAWFLRVSRTSLLENTVTSNFSFSHSIFYSFIELSTIFIKFEIVVCKTLSNWSLKFSVWKRVNPFPNKACFFRVYGTSLLKTLWEKEKLLVTSNFSFSHSVFYPFGELSAIYVKLEIVVCKLF